MGIVVLVAWVLLARAQTLVCDQAGCQPHPDFTPQTRVVSTLPAEADCLRTQLRLQDRFNQLRKQRPPARKGEKHFEARVTLSCQAKEG